jgi:polysaccharide transporter, PST family
VTTTTTPRNSIQLRDNRHVKKIVDNIGWLFFDKMLRLVAGLAIGVWVARYLGPADYGLLNYAISFVALFASLSLLGLNNIVVRDLVRNPENRDAILGSAFMLKLIGGVVSIIAAVIVQYVINPDEALIMFLVVIIASGFIFQSLDVIDFWFQARVLSKYIIWAKLFALVISALLRVVCIFLKAPVLAFTLIITVDLLLGGLGLLLVFRFTGGSIRTWRWDPGIVKSLMRDSWPLAIAAVSSMTYMKIDQVFIKSMLGNHELGLYSASVTIAEIWYFIPLVITQTFLPVILKTKKISEELYIARLQMLYDVMTVLSIIVSVVITIFANPIIHLLYGNSYAGAGTILAIYFWAGLPLSLTMVSTQYIVSENFTTISIYRSVTGALSNILLNILLIPRYGIVGAAWATIISYSFVTLVIVVFSKTRQQVFCIMKSFNLVRILVSWMALLKEFATHRRKAG